MEDIKLIVKSLKLDKNGNVVMELASLETLERNLINKLNSQIGSLDGYKAEIELLRIILENKNKSNLDLEKITNQINNMQRGGVIRH